MVNAAPGCRRSQSMKILLLVDSLQVGGAERHVVDLARGLAARGHHTEVACGDSGPLNQVLLSAGIPCHVFAVGPVKRRLNLSYVRRLRTLLRARDFDIAHAHLYGSAAALTLARLGLKCTVVVTSHSESAWQGLLSRCVSGIFYRAAHATVAVSASIAAAIVERHRVSTTRIHVIPNALYDAPLPAPPCPAAQEGTVVGVVSRLCPGKGVEDFLQAFTCVAASRPQVRAVIVGDGPLRSMLERMARSSGLGTRIRFLGAVPDGRVHIGSFDVLVMPSHSEGSSLVVLEGLAAQVAVLATAVGDVHDRIQSGVDGILLAPGRPKELARALGWLVDSPEARHCIASNGKRRVDDSVSYNAALDRVEQAYGSALQARWEGPLRVAASITHCRTRSARLTHALTEWANGPLD